MSKTWEDHYIDRVNNDDYLNNYTSTYHVFLRMILMSLTSLKDHVIFREEGCGIGMISKCLYLLRPDIMKGHVKNIEFRDVNTNMLLLCRENTKGITEIETDYHLNDILTHSEYEPNTFLVTHGVLEHFSDESLNQIILHFDHKNIHWQFHYVPTDGYETCSFGDERLMPFDYWSNLFKPHVAVIDNNWKDLYFAKHVS